MLKIITCTKSWPLAQEFRIARGAKNTAETIIVELQDGKYLGRAEATPYARYGESLGSVQAQINALTEKNLTLTELQHAISNMPAGAARNALDCAVWDLTAQQHHANVAQLADLKTPEALVTAQTLSINSPAEMAKQAATLSFAPLIKVKLDQQQIIERAQAIHLNAPNSQFIIDANESWDLATLKAVMPQLAKFNVVLIEQPLPAQDDHLLADLNPEIPLCADESCHTSDDIAKLKSLYQAVNIKLDKTGGLTEAIKLLDAAKRENMLIMTGCMVASSLAMAPAFILAQYADFVDLDGPLLLAQDIEHGFEFNLTTMSNIPVNLWGNFTRA